MGRFHRHDDGTVHDHDAPRRATTTATTRGYDTGAGGSTCWSRSSPRTTALADFNRAAFDAAGVRA